MAWRALNYTPRSIIQDLWRLSDLECTGHIEVRGANTTAYLVMLLELIDRGDRIKVTRAINTLLKEGLLTREGDIVTVRTEPASTATQNIISTLIISEPSRCEVASISTPSRVGPALISQPNCAESADLDRNFDSQILREEEVKEEDQISPIENFYLDLESKDERGGGGTVIELRCVSERPSRRPAEVVKLRPNRPESVAYAWLDAALGGGGRAADLQTNRRAYELIGRKPESERVLVAQHMLATTYIAQRRSKAHPEHLVRYWQQFVEGPRNFDFERADAPRRGFAGPSRIPTAEEYAQARASAEVVAW